MVKKKFILLIVIFVIILIGIATAITISIKNKTKFEAQLNILSQCYTNLQPSSEITKSGLPSLTINSNILTLGFNKQINELDIVQVSDTGSMNPTISDKSFVIVKKPKVEELFIGDIIVFNCHNKEILHRIINIENNTYFTKGDNNNIQDDCLTKFENIKSKVIGVLY